MKIGIVNQKGGVGKTTLSVNIATFLSKINKNNKVMLIDADPQGSSLDWASVSEKKIAITVVGFPRPTIHKEIESIGYGYDHVIIDGPPRVTNLARSVIMASDTVIIPVQPSPYDIWASNEVVKLVEEAKIFKENLKYYFVINRKITNTAIGRDVKDALSAYNIPVLNTTIGQRIIFAESSAQGKSVLESDPNSIASQEIVQLVNEILENS